ncbi:hypothetical protein NUSPORA_00574 [Nucleospora cyclopteri]
MVTLFFFSTLRAMVQNSFTVISSKKLTKDDIKSFTSEFTATSGYFKELTVCFDQKTYKIPVESGVSTLKETDDRIFLGFLNGKVGFIQIYDIIDAVNNYEGNEELLTLEITVFYMYSHRENVCTLEIINDTIFSGSWDNNLLCYDIKEKEIYNIFTHTGSVWKIKKINEKEIVSGCADGKLRIFKKDDSGKFIFKDEIFYCNFPIRGLCYLKDTEGEFLYCGTNEGKILKIDKNSKKIVNYRDVGILTFCLSLHFDSITKQNILVVGGESKRVFFLNSKLEVFDFVQLNDVETVWDIKFSNNDILLGCNNGCIYTINKGEEESKGCILKESKGQVKEENTKEVIFSQGGKKYKRVGKTIFIEDEKGQWEIFGEATNTFDHEFTVELEGRTFKLCFNDGDNFHEVAANFLLKHKLNSSYNTDIVEFIEKNFKKINYEFYSTISLTGIKKFLGNSPIIELLEEIEANRRQTKLVDFLKLTVEIEEALEKVEIKFIKFDIAKYLIYKEIPIDLSFILNDKINNKKEGKAFCMAVTNLFNNLPFPFDLIDKRVRKIKDEGYLQLEEMNKYIHNKEKYMNKKQ